MAEVHEMAGYSIGLGENSEWVAKIPVGNEDPLSVLTAMELITILKSYEQARGYVTGQLRVMPKAMAWVAFERSGRVKKWSVRSVVRAKATWAFIAGIAVVVAFWIDLFNKVMEALRSLRLVP